MCTVLLPPGDKPTAVNKYIISYHINSIPSAVTKELEGGQRKCFFLSKTQFFSHENFSFNDALKIHSLQPTRDYLYLVSGVVIKALRYKPAGRGFDSRCCHWNFSVT